MKRKQTIVFIHGLHDNSHSWGEWKLFFENLGYVCLTPNYPFHEGNPPTLRQNPDKRLAKIRLNDIVAYHTHFIDSLGGEPPILIGHSMGGLVVQKLIQAQKGALGICITSASPTGIMSFKWSFIKSNIGAVNPLMGNSLFCGTKEWFHYAICNTLSRQQSDEIYEKTVVPESRNIPRSSRLADGKIDFGKPHQPLLFIGAEKDHIIPIELNIKNWKAYRDERSVTDFKEFKGRGHSICFQSGWPEVAQFVDSWILENIQ
jgi:pimeloyl-ACP methyl ester carboxylesterase